MSKKYKVKRTIKKVQNVEKGTFIDTINFFKKEEREIILLRGEIETNYQKTSKHTLGKALYLCGTCFKPVKIRSIYNNRTLFFKHFLDAPKCPFYEGKSLSKEETLKRMYRGNRESVKHSEMKHNVERWVSQTKGVSKSDVEKRLYATFNPKKWRVPDVYAIYMGKKLVFEVQLSTTFVSIIVERNSHYEKDSTHIIWIFDKFNPEKDMQKMTQKDTYYEANSNVFVFNDIAKKESEKRGELILLCYYIVPELEEGKIVEHTERKLISLSDLTFSDTKNLPYYFDFTGTRSRLIAQTHQNPECFITKYIDGQRTGYEDELDEEIWTKLKSFSNKESLKIIIEALWTTKKGIAKYDGPHNFVWFSNIMLNQRKQFGTIFIKALETYNILKEVKALDKTGSFTKSLRRHYTKKPEQKLEYDCILKIVFPELF